MNFGLISNDLYHSTKETKDIMYEIQGNIPLIKNICCHKIEKSFKIIGFDINQIKHLKIFAAKDDENIFTELWLDFDENNDLCFITKVKDLSINNALRIEWLVAQWLLSE